MAEREEALDATSVPATDERYPRCPVCGRGLRCTVSAPNDWGNCDVTYRCVQSCVPTPEGLDGGEAQNECEGDYCHERARFCGSFCAECA